VSDSIDHKSDDFYYKLDFIRTVLCIVDECELDDILSIIERHGVNYKKENTVKFFLENKI
jgi:hypothetical protein